MASYSQKLTFLPGVSVTNLNGELTYFTVVIGQHQAHKLLVRTKVLQEHVPFARTILIADHITLATLERDNFLANVIKSIDNFEVIPDSKIFSTLTTGDEAFEDGISLYKKLGSEYENFKLQEMYNLASNLLVFAAFAAFRKKSQRLVYFNLSLELDPLSQKALSEMQLGSSFMVALTVEPDQRVGLEPTEGLRLSLVRPSDLLAQNSTLLLARCRFTADLMYMAGGDAATSGLRDVFQVSKLQLDQIERFRSVYVQHESFDGFRECAEERMTFEVAARMRGLQGAFLLCEEIKAEMNITNDEPLSHRALQKKYAEAVGLKPLEYMLEAIFRQCNVCQLRSNQKVRMGTMTLSGNESSIINFIQRTVLDPASVGVLSK